MPTLTLGVCAVIALAFCRSLWWFVAAAAVLLLWLRFAHRPLEGAQGTDRSRQRMLRLDTGTILSLVSYALLGSVALLTVRAALGWLELPTVPFEQTGLAPYMRRASVGFYDKSELRLALLELLVLTVTFAIVFVQSSSHWVQQRGKPLVMHPMSAAFAFVLYFSSIHLPPYPIHLEHWDPLVAAATGIRNGAWPSASGTDPGHGPLSPVLLAAWLSWFGLSTLSLSAAMMAGNLVAGMASFALIRSLTGSRAVALLGASYLLLGTTATQATAIAVAAPAQIALESLLLYISLRDRRGRLWPGFVFGLTTIWNPLYGAFAAFGFLLAHCSQVAHATGNLRTARVRGIFAMLAGIGLSLATVWATRGAFGLPSLEVNAAPSLLLFIPGLLYLSRVLRRLGRSRSLNARHLFVGASLVSAIPCAFVAPGQSDPSHIFPVYWVLIPGMALVIQGFIRRFSLRPKSVDWRRIRAAPLIRLTPMVLCALFVILFPIDRLNQYVATYATKYETERQKWYMDCASGRVCDSEKKPSLMSTLRQAAQPLPEPLAERGSP